MGEGRGARTEPEPPYDEHLDLVPVRDLPILDDLADHAANRVLSSQMQSLRNIREMLRWGLACILTTNIDVSPFVLTGSESRLAEYHSSARRHAGSVVAPASIADASAMLRELMALRPQMARGPPSSSASAVAGQ